jgi:hypothetical protein
MRITHCSQDIGGGSCRSCEYSRVLRVDLPTAGSRWIFAAHLFELCQPSRRPNSRHSRNLPGITTNKLLGFEGITGSRQWMRVYEDFRKKSQVRAFLRASIGSNVAHDSSHFGTSFTSPLRSVCGLNPVAVWPDLKNDKASNITIDLVGESLTHLTGTFIGPEDTPYQGGTYEVVSTGPRYDHEHQHRRSTVTSLVSTCTSNVLDSLPPFDPEPSSLRRIL